MTTLLELEDEITKNSIEFTEDGDTIFLAARGRNDYVSFNLTKEKARLLIESIQSYFQIT